MQGHAIMHTYLFRILCIGNDLKRFNGYSWGMKQENPDMYRIEYANENFDAIAKRYAFINGDKKLENDLALLSDGTNDRKKESARKRLDKSFKKIERVQKTKKETKKRKKRPVRSTKKLLQDGAKAAVVNLSLFTAATYGAYEALVTDDGFLRNGLTHQFQMAHDGVNANHNIHYQSAMQGIEMGVTPVALMMLQAMETGFFDVDSGGDAQGLYQNQVLNLIERTQRYAASIPVYQELSDIQRDAIDNILNDTRMSSPAGRREMAEDLKDGRVSALEQTFLNLRNDPIFMGQLMGAHLHEHHPRIRLGNLPLFNTDEAIEIVMDEVTQVYGNHFMGNMGHLYMQELSVEAANLTIADTQEVQAIADQVQASNGWGYQFYAQSWIRKAEANPGIFTDGVNTLYGDVLINLRDYIELKTTDALSPMGITFETPEENSLSQTRPRARPPGLGQERLAQN